MAPFSESRNFRGWWNSKTSLEQKLIIFTTILSILCFCLIITVIVLDNKKCPGLMTTVGPASEATSPSSVTQSVTTEPTQETKTTPTEPTTTEPPKPTEPTMSTEPKSPQNLQRSLNLLKPPIKDANENVTAA